ncbi:MAG: hypothetical protein PHI31_14585 [Desulfuromonadaceae bacterium]|nr:hypothetical protein [Desulfuromonadaceae bacterium]
MRRKLIPVVAIFLASLFQSYQAEASKVDRLLELPEKKIDIGIAALTLEKRYTQSLT